MANYTKLTNIQAKKILELFGMSEDSSDLRELIPLSLGISNSNYKVVFSNRPSLLLKISNDKNKEQLQAEQDILVALHQAKYPFSLKPFPLKNQNSNLKYVYVYEFEDYHGVLFPFMDGIPPGPSDFTCREVGKALGALHSLTIPNETLKTIRRHEEVGFGALEISHYTQSIHCPEDFKNSVQELFPQGLDAFIHAPFFKCLIHGDLYYDNTLFHQNQLSSVLDFEQAGIGEALLDLGISISGTCLEKGHIIDPLVHSYLKGYESVRPLPQLEKTYLIDGIILGLLSISLWRIKRFTEGNLNPSMKFSYRDLLQKAHHFKANNSLR